MKTWLQPCRIFDEGAFKSASMNPKPVKTKSRYPNLSAAYATVFVDNMETVQSASRGGAQDWLGNLTML